MLLDFLALISHGLPESNLSLDLEHVQLLSFGITCITSSIRVPEFTCRLDESSRLQSQTLTPFVIFKNSRRAKALLTLHNCDLQHEVRGLLV